MSEDRTYSRDEVALVLRRLGELHVRETPAADLTRGELEQIAAESGLDVRNLDTALAELETVGKRDARLLGLRVFAVVRRSVRGELTHAKLEAAIALINRSVGIIGRHQINGLALSWFGRHVAVSITEESTGSISIQIEERFHNTARARLGFAGSVSGMGGFATLVAFANAGLEPVGFLVGIALPGLAYVATRIMHGRGVDATDQQLGVLGDQLAALLADPPAP